MGTSIVCVIPKEREYSTTQIEQKLQTVFEQCQPEFEYLVQHGNFTHHITGNWSVSDIRAEPSLPAHLTIEEGGFIIDIYAQVVFIGSLERFFSVYLSESKIARPLRTILFTIAKIFRSSNKALLVAEGFGDSDHIRDLGYTEGANFEQLCAKMQELHGPPAITFSELYDRMWYLQK